MGSFNPSLRWRELITKLLSDKSKVENLGPKGTTSKKLSLDGSGYSSDSSVSSVSSVISDSSSQSSRDLTMGLSTKEKGTLYASRCYRAKVLAERARERKQIDRNFEKLKVANLGPKNTSFKGLSLDSSSSNSSDDDSESSERGSDKTSKLPKGPQ
jgi:hypothetical protein